MEGPVRWIGDGVRPPRTAQTVVSPWGLRVRGAGGRAGSAGGLRAAAAEGTRRRKALWERRGRGRGAFSSGTPPPTPARRVDSGSGGARPPGQRCPHLFSGLSAVLQRRRRRRRRRRLAPSSKGLGASDSGRRPPSSSRGLVTAGARPCSCGAGGAIWVARMPPLVDGALVRSAGPAGLAHLPRSRCDGSRESRGVFSREDFGRAPPSRPAPRPWGGAKPSAAGRAGTALRGGWQAPA